MDEQNECQQLNKQLSVYRAFKNQSAIAAIMRQMADSHCATLHLNLSKKVDMTSSVALTNTGHHSA